LQILDCLKALMDIKWTLKSDSQPGMVIHTFASSTLEIEAGGPRVQGQPGLHTKTVSKKEK
jgi:hypothetical protein